MNYVIIDFEATCSNKNEFPREEMEIIEFAALCVREDFSSAFLFDFFVRPVRNPILTEFCKNLTSITQSDVDHAQPFTVVFPYFNKWLSAIEDLVFCSWGAYDKKQLIKDLSYHNIDDQYPFDERHFNLKEMYAKRKGWERGCGMAEALRQENLELSGIHHRGVDDVQNIAKLLPFIFSE